MDSAKEIPFRPEAEQTSIPMSPPSGDGMYRAHGLERHVNTYTLTDSDMDLLESSGPPFDLSIAVSSFFGSIAIACYLAGATLPKAQWDAQQWALFYYAPRGCAVISVLSTIL